MTEHFSRERPQIEGLQPGEVISFADITELLAFEDLMAPLVDPTCNPELWAARPSLRDLIRPPKFNGNIRDITLTVMNDPYARLLDARSRGWTFQSTGKGSRSFERTQEDARQFIEHYYGFIFDAEAHSSNPALRGRIEAELWYYPTPRVLRKAGTFGKYILKSGEVRPYVSRQDAYYNAGSSRGEAIRRVVTKPRYDIARFQAAHDTSCAIGFMVIGEAMRHAISTPMQD